MTLDADFFARVKPLYSPVMGAETMAPLLYSLVRFTRPRRLLEIGSGYTTPFLLKALADTVAAHEQEKKALGTKDSLLIGDYYKNEYSPRLLCLDNNSHPDSTATKVVDLAKEMQIDGFLTVAYENFQGYTKKLGPDSPYFDFVWFDCGGIAEYASFVQEYWRLINPDGGLLLLHSTLSNLVINTFMKSLKLRQATTEFHNFELLSLLEPNKYSQNSVSIIRFTSRLQERLYTVNP